MCVRELLQDVTEKMQRHRARAWSFDPGKNAELGNVWRWIGPGGHKGGRRSVPSKWLGEEAQQVVLLLRWRLYRELYGRRGPSIVPRRGNYGARRLQVEEAEREVRKDAVEQLLPLFLLPG